MRIGIDAHHVNGKPQGSRTYLLELVRALSRACANDGAELVIYSFRPEETSVVLPAPALEHRRIFPQSARVRLPFVAPLLALRDRLSVLHSQYIAPPFSFVPDVVTIHDILFETHPDLFAGAFSRRSAALIRRSAKRARVVLTVSEFSRSALVERYHLSPDKVIVTPNAVDREAFHPGSDELPGVRERYGLDGPFLLSVGRIEPRKNLPRLIRAFSRARERLGGGLRLAIAGQEDFRSREVFEEAQRQPDAFVRFLGPVPDRDLPALYNLAEALAYPSLTEAFGLPVLEAMACGTPVLASPRGALPEVGGDAVLWVEPEDEEAIASGIERILTDTTLREGLRAKGPRRAARFDWNDTAKGTLEAYRRAFDRP
ncbi:MAG TPA: glycosyltransferase family 1 protein [Vicinamibacteria bacterium]|jgi:glycosyltransferase involved in cell wall biosynthesis